jgi:hypothetical protein
VRALVPEYAGIRPVPRPARPAAAGLAEEPPLKLLDRAYAALAREFAARRPEEHTITWYGP